MRMSMEMSVIRWWPSIVTSWRCIRRMTNRMGIGASIRRCIEGTIRMGMMVITRMEIRRMGRDMSVIRTALRIAGGKTRRVQVNQVEQVRRMTMMLL